MLESSTFFKLGMKPWKKTGILPEFYRKKTGKTAEVFCKKVCYNNIIGISGKAGAVALAFFITLVRAGPAKKEKA